MVLVLAGLPLACTGTRMETIDESMNGRTITASRGASFEISLEETPATGFRWTLTSDGAPICALLDDRFDAPASTTPGAPGRHRWRFEVKQAGQATVGLAKRRPWDVGAAKPPDFQVRVNAID